MCKFNADIKLPEKNLEKKLVPINLSTIKKSMINVLKLGVQRTPKPLRRSGETLKHLPKYDFNSEEDFQIDLRGKNLNQIELNENDIFSLSMATFDNKTIWPNNIETYFPPKEIINKNKDPGLGIKELHKLGITGKGVGIAIIDQTLLVNHKEYKNNLRFYKNIGPQDECAQMHGCSVSSIAVGNESGIAPDSGLYYISARVQNNNANKKTFKYINQAIKEILLINKNNDKKIKVISLSAGCNKSEEGYDEFIELAKKCNEQGIFLISSNLKETHNLRFTGLGRDPKSDPNNLKSFKPGLFRENMLDNNQYKLNLMPSMEKVLLVPMDSRTTASPTGEEDFVFYRNGGRSRSIPYIAGMYALSCQIKPNITPESFRETALNTGDVAIKKYGNGRNVIYGKIINPKQLINSIKKTSSLQDEK